MSRARLSKTGWLSAALATAMAVAVTPGIGATGTVSQTDDAEALASAIAADPTWVVGAEIVTTPASTTTAIVSGSIAGFPTTAGEAIALSTGDVNLITSPNDSQNTGVSLGGENVRGDSDLDVTILRIDLDVPEGVNCLAGIDFRFLSDEFPEYVGSTFNDAFIAEIDESTWTTDGSEIIAPNNFAFDPAGSEISINASGNTSFAAEESAGTTFDGATPALTAATPISSGAHSLFLSIFDQGDNIYDSVVLVDNLRFSFVANPEEDCVAGAKPVEEVPDDEGDIICAGLEPTIVGTEGNDLLLGTPGDDIIFGLGGNDRLLGFAGNDILCGGDGDDELRGNTGNDIASGGAGNDRIYGEAGIDFLAGGDGNDRLDGGTQTDTLIGGPDNDQLFGGADADVLQGDGGNDRLAGGTQDDTLNGGVGDDQLRGDAGNDRLIGGGGIDSGNGGSGGDLCETLTIAANCELLS